MEKITRWVLNIIQVVIVGTIPFSWFWNRNSDDSGILTLGLVVLLGTVSFFRFLFFGNSNLDSKWGWASLAIAIITLVPGFFIALVISK